MAMDAVLIYPQADNKVSITGRLSIEKWAKDAGHDVNVPFLQGRTDAFAA